MRSHRTQYPPLPADEAGQTWRQFVWHFVVPILAVLCLGIAASLWARTYEIRPTSNEPLPPCSHLTDNLDRLTCYDGVVKPHHPGRGANAPLIIRRRQDERH